MPEWYVIVQFMPCTSKNANSRISTMRTVPTNPYGNYTIRAEFIVLVLRIYWLLTQISYSFV